MRFAAWARRRIQTKWAVWRSACLILAFAVLLPTAVGAAELFTASLDSPGLSATTAQPGTMRSRVAGINPETLALFSQSPPETLRFNLFADLELSAEIDRTVSSADGGRTWIGQIAHGPGQAVLHIGDGVVAGRIQSAGGRVFDVSPRGDGLVLIREVAPEGEGDLCAEPVIPEVGGFLQIGGEITASSAAVIDVMVCYTPAARAGAGGTAGIEAQIALAVDLTNLAFEDSGVFPRVRLVHTVEVDYTESGDMSTDLSQLRGTSDGFMDEVHALRNAHGADVVSLIVEQSNYAGIAYIMLSPSYFAPYAFNVVSRTSATSYLTFCHELGHNLGCAHDHDNGTQGLYVYSFGHRFLGQSGTLWRSIMAYAPGARVGHYSNPDVLHDGASTGVAGEDTDAADNARSLNGAGPYVAAFRETALVTPPSITLDRAIYPANATAEIHVSDVSLAGQSSVDVSVTTNGGDAETVALPETAAGEFIGGVALAAGVPTPGDGVIQTAHGVTITVVHSASPEISASAGVDAQPPIFAGLISAETGIGAVFFAWDPANEEGESVTYRIHRAAGPGGYDWESPLATTDGLTHAEWTASTGSTWWYAVRAEDAAGNRDSNTAEFEVTVAGPLDHFEWSEITADPYVNQAVPFTIQALDVGGNHVTAHHESATLTALIGTGEYGVGFAPTFTDDFEDGLWSGEITFHVPATGVRMRARASNGAIGESVSFDVDGPEITVTGQQVVEGDDGSSVAVFNVSLSVPGSATVSCYTLSGTAQRDEDYAPHSADLTFIPGTLSQPVSVEIFGDLIQEEDETFEMILHSSSGASIAVGTAECTILNDDAPEDATLAKLLGLRTLTEDEEAAADTNSDGVVDAADLVTAVGE